MILVASVFLAAWVCQNSRRQAKLNSVRSQAAMDKAQLVLESARQSLRAERELGDFVAHEVRNPVSAAISACCFVKTSVMETEPLKDEESRRLVREDIEVVDTSLRFVSDLLRQMLDMHRAADHQLTLKMKLTDILHDILEPVAAMMHSHGVSTQKVKVEVHCPPDLLVLTDAVS